MPLLTWLLGEGETSNSDDLAFKSTFESPDSLVQRVQQDFAKLQELDLLCQSQGVKISSLNSQMRKLRTQLDKEKTANANLQKEKANLRTEVQRLCGAIQKRNEDLKNVQHQLAKSETTEHRIVDLMFENEYLKCTASSSSLGSVTKQAPAKSLQNPQLETPFVIVLVDGDAYHWSSDHFKASLTTPGAHAAQCLKEEVQKYLLQHSYEIPLQAKIVARVVCNGRDRAKFDRNIAVKANRTRCDSFETFMLQFSESAPLFDFFDAGRGKERADEKIKENFHLFIDNPCCHRIFFACCTDNGFARLLEQYCNSETARQKIVLVHPGYLQHEIEKFKLENLEWPRVFSREKLPLLSQLKVNRIQEQENAMLKRQQEEERGKKEYARILTEYAVATHVSDVCEPIDLNALFQANTGVRMAHRTVKEKNRTDCGNDLVELPDWDAGID